MKILVFFCLFYLFFDSRIAFGLCSQAWEIEMTSELSKQKAIPLICSDKIGEVAQAFADDMCRRGYFSHVSPEGYKGGDRLRGLYTYWWGENLYRTTNYDPKLVVGAWMNHSGYRQVITDPNLKSVGFGGVLCNGYYLIVADYTDRS